MTLVKICGITNIEDARAAVTAGADMLGMNFVPSSKRYIEPSAALAIKQQLQASQTQASQKQVLWVGVVADLSLDELTALQQRSGVDRLQLHGSESPAALEQLLDSGCSAFKAVRIANQQDVACAWDYSGAWLLADAKAPSGELGGSGHTFDWQLVRELAEQRPLILAGGLTPLNVAAAVTQVRPFAVDVASGVESAPGRKDPQKMAEFIANAQA